VRNQRFEIDWQNFDIMRRYLYIAIALIFMFISCGQKQTQTWEGKAFARSVPERADDFVWENDYMVYRAYGQALEKELISPGFDVWVKNTHDLVADQRYKDDLENNLSYHIDHGNGKDCYKVGKTLGGGASTPYIDGKLSFPATNYHSVDIIEQTPKKVVFVLHYPQWETNGYNISLDKQITVEAGKRFCKAEDTYKFNGPADTLTIAAGIVRHKVEDEYQQQDKPRFAIWEYASDTTTEAEDGMIGLAVVMPKADNIQLVENHIVGLKTIHSGDPLVYYFGSGWSKFDLETSEDWFDIVREFNPKR